MRAILVVLVLCLTPACSLPRIYQYHDPLTPAEHLALGVSYETRGETELAIAEYKKTIALALDREGITATVFLGNVYAGLDQFQTAEEFYREALSLDPHHGQALNNLASILGQQRIQLEEAEALIRAALAEAGSGNNEKQKGIYLLTLGEVLLRQERYSEALDNFRAAEAFSDTGTAPWLIPLYIHMAEAYEGLGQMAEAQQARKRAETLRAARNALRTDEKIACDSTQRCWKPSRD
jgi:tetratricopeptide (TPR) repeat protein